MSMERWNPFRDFNSMRQAMDRWVDDRFTNPWSNPSAQANALSVALDIHETETGYELEASLPGVKPEDVDIQVDRETVTLRGTTASSEQSEEGRTSGRNYIYRERRAGSFFRTVRLPEAIDADKVEATLDHGLLRVQLPKLAGGRNRRVQVRANPAQGQSAPVGTFQTPPQAAPAPSGEAIAANSDNESGPVATTQSGSESGSTKPMSEQPQNKPDDRVSNLKEGVTGYGGEKQGLDASQNDAPAPQYHEGGLQARGNDATPSSTSGMSDVRAHQSVGQGSGNQGGGPEGGEPNQYNDQAQTPNPF